MKYIVGILVAVAIYMTISWFTRPKAPPTFSNTDQMMAYWAGETVTTMQKEKKVTLDYSMDSITSIEKELVMRFKNAKATANQTVNLDTAIQFGAYVGEVLRRHEGGFWAVDDSIAGPRTFPMKTTNNIVYFPVAWSWTLLSGGTPGQADLKNPLPNPASTNIPNIPAPPNPATILPATNLPAGNVPAPSN